MKSKQTIRVADILARANYYLAYQSPYITPDMRKGAASLLETILQDSGNYSGFVSGRIRPTIPAAITLNTVS